MEKLIINIEGRKNLQLLLGLFEKLDFVKIEGREKQDEGRGTGRRINKRSKNINEAPIIHGDPNIDTRELAGIWKDHPKTLDEIREKAWGKRQ